MFSKATFSTVSKLIVWLNFLYFALLKICSPVSLKNTLCCVPCFVQYIRIISSRIWESIFLYPTWFCSVQCSLWRISAMFSLWVWIRHWLRIVVSFSFCKRSKSLIACEIDCIYHVCVWVRGNIATLSFKKPPDAGVTQNEKTCRDVKYVDIANLARPNIYGKHKNAILPHIVCFFPIWKS